MAYFRFMLMLAIHTATPKKTLYIEHDAKLTRADIGPVKKYLLITGQKEPADNEKKQRAIEKLVTERKELDQVLNAVKWELIHSKKSKMNHDI